MLNVLAIQVATGDPAECEYYDDWWIFGEESSGDEDDSDGEGSGDDDDKEFDNEVKRNYKMNKRDEEAFEAFMNKDPSGMFESLV